MHVVRMRGHVVSRCGSFLGSSQTPHVASITNSVGDTNTFFMYGSVNLPRSLSCQLEQFATFYRSHHPNQRLTWQFFSSTAVLRMQCGELKDMEEPSVKTVRKKCGGMITTCDILMPVDHALVCLAYDDLGADRLNLGDIVRHTRLTVMEVSAIIHALTLPSHPLLTTVSTNSASSSTAPIITTTLNTETIIAINPTFRPRHLRLEIRRGKIVYDEQRKNTMADLVKNNAGELRAENETSIHAIEAAIMRVMKAQKELTHDLLIVAVIDNLLMFRPKVDAIKKGIERLLAREYLERDVHSHTLYRYIA